MDELTSTHTVAMVGGRQTEIESKLRMIWSTVLETTEVGIHDDFFTLGGDSLAAMRCLNRVTAAYGVEVNLELLLLQSASIAEVAAELERLLSAPAACSAAESSEP